MVWSFVELFLSCVVYCCSCLVLCDVVLAVCFLSCTCVCDRLLFFGLPFNPDTRRHDPVLTVAFNFIDVAGAGRANPSFVWLFYRHERLVRLGLTRGFTLNPSATPMVNPPVGLTLTLRECHNYLGLTRARKICQRALISGAGFFQQNTEIKRV